MSEKIAETNTSLPRKKDRTNQSPFLVGGALLLLACAAMCVQFKVPTIMINLMDEFSMSATAASWLMSSVTLVGIIMAIPSGMLSQKFGPKRMAIVSGIVIILGSLIGIFANVGWLLIVSRAIEGVGIMIISVVAPTIIQQCVRPERRSSATGLYGIFGSSATFIASVATPTIFESLGYEGVWVVFAVATAIACVILFFGIKMPTEEEIMATAAPSQAATQDAENDAPPRFRELLTKDIVFTLIGFGLMNMGVIAVSSYVPTILQMQGWSATMSGLVSSIPGLCSIISSPVGGIIADKLKATKALMLICNLVVGPMCFILFTCTGPVIWVAAFVEGIIGLAGVGMYIAFYTFILPRPQLTSIAMGIFGLVQGLGSFIGSWLIQLVLGPSLTHWVLAGAVIWVLEWIGAVCVWKVKDRQRQ